MHTQSLFVCGTLSLLLLCVRVLREYTLLAARVSVIVAAVRAEPFSVVSDPHHQQRPRYCVEDAKKTVKLYS